jgi:MYXO-CTERM domain-containing protein
MAGSTLASLGLFVIVPAPAAACSGPSYCAREPTVAMLGDLTARPTNACVFVDYGIHLLFAPEQRAVLEAGLSYVAADGSRVPLRPTDWRHFYCPESELAADSDYVLVGPSWSGCGLEGETELATFRTGASADRVPPSAPGAVVDVAPCVWDACDSSACCGPYLVLVHESEWAAATDDRDVVAYAYGGELRFATRTRWWNQSMVQYGPQFGYAGGTEYLDPHNVRAIDMGGNLSAAAPDRRDCAPPPRPSDAGMLDASSDRDASDADAHRDDGGAPAIDGGAAAGSAGCRVTPGAGRGPLGTLALSMFVALAVVSRRRR